jgi:gliding motility-associated-like protein
MKKGQENIDQLFKDSLSNFEADVNPSVWKNIEQELQTPSGNVADRSVRSDKIFKAVKLKHIISFLALSGAAILAILYFTKKAESPSASVNVKALQQASPVNQQGSQKIVPSSELPQQVKTVNPVVEEKRALKTNDQKASEMKPVISDVERSKEKENVPLPASSSSVKDSKDNAVHLEKNSVVKSNTESRDNSKVAEDNHESAANSQVDASDNEHPENGTGNETDNNHLDFRFFIPDMFTPNGDGVNEYFRPDGLNFKDYEMWIYDQLGTEIFSSTDINNTWDGKLRNGNEASSGKYLCKVNVKDLSGKNHPYYKPITLKR